MPRKSERREMREKRIKERDDKRAEAAIAEDKAMDDMVRRSIKDQGA